MQDNLEAARTHLEKALQLHRKDPRVYQAFAGLELLVEEREKKPEAKTEARARAQGRRGKRRATCNHPAKVRRRWRSRLRFRPAVRTCRQRSAPRYRPRGRQGNRTGRGPACPTRQAGGVWPTPRSGPSTSPMSRNNRGLAAARARCHGPRSEVLPRRGRVSALRVLGRFGDLRNSLLARSRPRSNDRRELPARANIDPCAAAAKGQIIDKARQHCCRNAQRTCRNFISARSSSSIASR